MKLSKLKKMKMPKDQEMDMSELDMSEGESPSDESAESPEMEMAEDEMEMAPSPLDSISDDELMAEIEKRGLMSQLSKSEKPEDAEKMPPDFGM